MCMYVDPTGLEEKSSTGLPNENFEPAPVNHDEPELTFGVDFDGAIEIASGSSRLVAVKNSSIVSDTTLEDEFKKLGISGKFSQDNMGFVTPYENYEFNVFVEGEGYSKTATNKLVVARQGKPYAQIRVFENEKCEGEPSFILTQKIYNHWGKECDFSLNRNNEYHNSDGKKLVLLPSMTGDVCFNDLI